MSQMGVATVFDDGLNQRLDGEGRIDPDSATGLHLGFTSDLYDGWLWFKDGEVMVSFIESKLPGRGHLRTLFDRIDGLNYRLAVPTPLGRMEKILVRRGMTPEMDETPDGPCEVWRKW